VRRTDGVRKRQRQAFHDDRRAVLSPDLACRGVQPARDPLRDPVIVVPLQQRQVAAQDFLGDLHHAALRNARIDAEVAQRAIQTIHVLGELEDFAAERARGVEHRVAVLEAAVAEGYEHVALGHEPAVVVRDAIGGCHTVSFAQRGSRGGSAHVRSTSSTVFGVPAVRTS
jgi:hypothetical protein